MTKAIIDRLEWYDGGDNVTYEYWIDPETGKTYLVDIEIVRDFDNAEEAEWSKSTIAETFMCLMGEYQDRQHHDPDFDVDAGLYDLYIDLTNLYNDNQEQ